MSKQKEAGIMKRFFPLLVAIVLIGAGSCSTVRYNKVYRYKDEFRENVKTYTRVRLKPEEKRTEVGSARLILEKKAGSGGEAVNAYFVVMRSSSSFRVDDEGFIKAGDKKYEIRLLDPVSEFKMKSEATISGIVTVDTSGVVTGQTADIDTRTWIEEKFVIGLSKEVATGILESADVLFRFYFGPIPVTYRLKGRRLGVVKEVFRDH